MKTIGYLFSQPKDFFSTALLEGNDSSEPSSSTDNKRNAETVGSARGEDAGPSSEHTCSTCSGTEKLQFSSFEEQRAHFKSDWHRLNVKRKLLGRPPLDEDSSDALLGGDQDEVSSISGSESSSDEAEEASEQAARGSGSQIVFKSGETRFAVWKVLLGPNSKSASPVELQQRLQDLREDSGFWAVILSRGGHFAAAIFACGPSLTPHSKDPKGAGAPIFQPIAHKTFHRYVVRAKAGGKQSTKDGTGKYAKSAGSQIRRHNEAALRQDILETLANWKGHLEKATRIFLAAPGANAATLFEEGSPLSPTDARLANVPFTTRRPTFSETKRVIAGLLSLLEPEAAPQPESQKAPDAPTQRPAKHQKAPQPPPLPVPEEPKPAPEPPLHQAARKGDAEEIARLLAEGHDPTVALGKTAYQVSANKAVRDAFRRHMAAEPDQWDWAAAGVPSPLSPEQEQQQQAKEAEKKARLKEKEKERKKRVAERKKAAAAAAAEDEISAAVQAAAMLAPRGPDAPSKKVERATAQQAAKREQMAAAAEARMAALKAAASQQQLW